METENIIENQHEEMKEQGLVLQQEPPTNIINDNKSDYLKRMILCGIYAVFFTF